MPKNQTNMGLLDSVIILILASMVVLFVLWVGSQLRGTEQFERLPGWLTGAASSFWTYLTGVGSSFLLAYIRRRTFGPGPNYLLWTGGTTVVMLGIVVAIVLILPTPSPGHPQQPERALLRFSLTTEKQDRPNLSFLQKLPLYRESHTIAAEADGHYQEYVDFPAQDKRFYARALRPVTSSQETRNPLSPVTELCFKENATPPDKSTPRTIRMDCREGERCSISAEDPGWAELCSADNDWRGWIRLVPLAHAQAPTGEWGWRVPSLETLKKMTDRERVGYTEFSIQSTQLSGLKDADSFQYLIRVNGLPLYVDGWAPEDMLKPFDAAKGFIFSFGLENLSFSGADNGCENIELRLLFRHRDRVVKEVTIARKYAALRDADVEEVKAEDGTTFAWSGRYVKPRSEDRMELFIVSTSDLQEAKRAKQRLDAAKLSYDGMEVVAVLRPPLNDLAYGIVLGLRQPSGQVRFTFDTVSAQRLRGWVFQQRTQDKSLIRHDTFLYQMRSGDAGTGVYKSCSAAAKKS